MNKNKIQNNDLTLLTSIFTVLLCLSFGSNVVAIKISLQGFGAFTTAGLRFSIASIAILVWAVVSKKNLRVEKNLLLPLIVLGLVFSVQLSLYHIGISKTNASRAVLIINSQPFFVMLLAHFFIPGDQISAKKIIGTIIGFTGVAIIFLGDENITRELQTGDLMVLCTSFIWGAGTVYTKKIIHKYEPHNIVLYQMLVASPLFFLGSWLFDINMIKSFNMAPVLSILYQGLIVSALCYILWAKLLQEYGVVSLHSFIFITPLAGVTLGGLLLGEPITANLIISMIFIMSGIIIINFKKPEFL